MRRTQTVTKLSGFFPCMLLLADSVRETGKKMLLIPDRATTDQSMLPLKSDLVSQWVPRSMDEEFFRGTWTTYSQLPHQGKVCLHLSHCEPLTVLSEGRVLMGHLILLPFPVSTGQFCEGHMLIIITMLIYDRNSHANTRRTESPTTGLWFYACEPTA